MVFSNERGSVIDARDSYRMYSVVIGERVYFSSTIEGAMALRSIAIKLALDAPPLTTFSLIRDSLMTSIKTK